jgi:hypothetical protein
VDANDWNAFIAAAGTRHRENPFDTWHNRWSADPWSEIPAIIHSGIHR